MTAVTNENTAVVAPMPTASVSDGGQRRPGRAPELPNAVRVERIAASRPCTC